jgi:HD-GYP domain-containing protein (c-di-GMP phosphodiesterase class II)
LLLTKIENEKFHDGFLGLVTFEMENYFRENQLRLAKAISKQISIQFINLDLYNDLKKFVIGVVKSLVSAIEAKDRYTRGHSVRVTRYAVMIGKMMQLNQEQRNTLRWASILHDIGKIGISDSVLNKKGPLTNEEFGLIKQHPKKGYQILEPVEQISYILPVVLHHHERYDGKGYPEGLTGDAIPIEARVIAVADTFDAITSTRSYRSSKTGYEAMQIIDKVSGTQLDPNVVDVFKKVYDRFLAEKL